jgi:hypothetical protein
MRADGGPDTRPPIEPRQPLTGEYVWIDDELPRGAVAAGNTKENPWKWVSTPQPVLGKLAHTFSSTEPANPGETRQHFFEKGADSLKVGTTDTLFAYVYIDPANPPKEIMMQWRFGESWEHRAYWGENNIPYGQNFSASRLPMGPLPKAGEWVRLEIPASSIGIEAAEERVVGWSFDHWGGNVYWDKVGVVRVPAAKPEVVQANLANAPLKMPKQGESGIIGRVTWKTLEGGKDFKNFSHKGKDSRAIWSKPTAFAVMKGSFTLPDGIYGAGKLLITSLRHGAKDGCLIEILLNGTQVFSGRDPADKREWGTFNFPYNEGLLKAGANEIQINNMEEKGSMGADPWYMVNKIEVEGVQR